MERKSTKEHEFQLKIINKKIKSEKGSVTVFVLATMLFIMLVMITSYTGMMNKLSNQTKQIQKIQEEYMVANVEEQMTDEYNKVIDSNKENIDISISLYKEDGGSYSVNEWTNKNVYVVVNYSGGYENSALKFYVNEKEEKYTNKYEITKNSLIRAEYGGKTAQIEITRIDKELPEVMISPNGGGAYAIPSNGDATNKSGIKCK